jgi:hypothetical protein
MFLPLMCSGKSCIYDANSVPSLRVSDDLQSPLGRKTDGFETRLAYRVIWVIEGSGQRIVENGGGNGKGTPRQ